MSKFISSGYLKTLIIALVILAIGVGGVVGLDLYDKLTAPEPQNREGQTERGGGNDMTITRGADGSFIIGDGGSGGAQDGEVSTFVADGEGGVVTAPGGEGMSVTRNADGSFTLGPAGEGEGGTTVVQNADGSFTTFPPAGEGGAVLRPADGEGGVTFTPGEGGGVTFTPGEGGGVTFTPGEGGMMAGRDPEAMKESIEQAVAEGRMTREEADAMLERMESGEGFVGGMMRPADGEGGGRFTPAEGGMVVIHNEDGSFTAVPAEDAEKEGE